MVDCRPRNGRRHLALWPYPTRLSGEEDGGGCWRNGFKENDVRTRGQDSGDAGEKELTRSKVRKLPSRAGGGKRGERSEVRLIHSRRLAKKKKIQIQEVSSGSERKCLFPSVFIFKH